jgi:hypothetical protein
VRVVCLKAGLSQHYLHVPDFGTWKANVKKYLRRVVNVKAFHAPKTQREQTWHHRLSKTPAETRLRNELHAVRVDHVVVFPSSPVTPLVPLHVLATFGGHSLSPYHRFRWP